MADRYSTVSQGNITTNLSSPVNVHINVSKLAQESLREIKKLRITLTKLISSDSSVDDGNTIQTDEADPPSASDGEPPPETPITTTGGTFQEDFATCYTEGNCDTKVASLISKLRSTFENLDKLAARMRDLHRTRGSLIDTGLQNALGLLSKVDQLEFSNANDLEAEMHSGARRSDWLFGRSDADRWSSKYWGRTRVVLEGILACSVFRRSNLNVGAKRRQEEHSLLSSTATDSRADLSHLLNEINNQYPKLAITLLEPGSSVNIAHVKVGDVMQCFITFRRLHPESVIIRGLTEPMLKYSIHSRSTSEQAQEPSQVLPSKSTEELLYVLRSSTTKSDSTPPGSYPVEELLISLLDPKSSAQTPSEAGRQGRRIAGVSTPGSFLGLDLADLVTPSRFSLFQRISQLANCALLHFSDDYQPLIAVRGLFGWLNAYQDLFMAPCRRCGQLIGQDISLPVWRGYPQTRRDSQPMEAQHEQCQAIV